MKTLIKYNLIILLTLFSLGCSQSGKKRNKTANNSSNTSQENTASTSSSGKTVVSMTKVNGVYEIPTEINGIKMNFIFDTGAGMISMSNTEAGFLYKQGKLTDEDIIGSENFIDANGDVTEGLVIRLKEVKIGNKVLYDVEASIVNNLKAPLLFGQSALAQFGKVSIDYDKSQITFE
jgi:aspartyl protease family protein